MSRHTNTDIIRELEVKVSLVSQQIEMFQREVDRLTSVQQNFIEKLLELQQSRLDKPNELILP